MTYSPEAHRRQVRDRLVHAIQHGGPGWFDYALDQAQRYEKEDASLHGGLVAAVRAAIKEAKQGAAA